MYYLVLLGLKRYKNSPILYVVFAIFSLSIMFDCIHIIVCSCKSCILTTVHYIV